MPPEKVNDLVYRRPIDPSESVTQKVWRCAKCGNELPRKIEWVSPVYCDKPFGSGRKRGRCRGLMTRGERRDV